MISRYEKLHAWRKERAVARGVEYDVILSRNSMWDLAHANPVDETELARIDSLGPWRRRTYGAELLSVLRDF